MVAYSPDHWTDLFVATAGASAALAGLVFVAVSVNVQRILGYPGLPERAVQTILLLLGIVVVSIFALVPGQSRTALGLELLGESLVCLVAIALLFRASFRASTSSDRPSYLPSQFVLSMPGVMLLLVGGASLIAGGGGGLYWTMAGLVLSVVGAVANAWILLVEILR